ncbi:MAG: class I adenylate-forming enzyme family protein [Actinomycetota bacterium]|nr:AMP-binding protein [Actinomycetota bacterium]
MGDFNLAEIGEAYFERCGDFDALFFEDETLTSGTIRSRVLSAGGALTQVIGPGDRVVIVMANCPEVAICYGAVWRAGGVVTPALFLLSAEEIRRIIEDSEAVAVITTPEFLPNILIAAEGLPTVKKIICTGAPDAPVMAFDELMDASAGPIVSRADDDLACLLYTGGTTGRSKGVMLSHRNVALGARSAFESGDSIDDDRAIAALPLAHGYGMMNSVATQFGLRGFAVLMRWFDPIQWPDLVQRFKIRRASLVPTMIQMLLSQPLEDFDLSSLQVVNSGAAPLATETIKEFERRVPSVTIIEGYGLSESSNIATLNPRYARRVGSIGKPVANYQVKVFDDDDNEVSTGEPGEICIRSDGVMTGYWNSPEVSAETLRGGWLHTGDIGKIDEDGYVWIVDRKKDLIIRGGFNIYPRDVEDVLLEHPAVEVAGVVGKPDPKYGEEIVAFVALRSGVDKPDESELVAHCKRKMGSKAYPRDVRIVGYLPLTPVGKIDRKALRQML